MYPQPLESMIPWQQLEGLEHLDYHILHIDEAMERAEVIFRLAAHKPIILHRHCSVNHSLVLEGEHLIYRPDGSLEEVRPTGRFTVIEPDSHPHSESGGNGGAIVLFSIFNNGGGALYELMDEQQNIIATMSMTDLVQLYYGAQPEQDTLDRQHM